MSALVTLAEIVEVGSNIIYVGDNLPIIKLYNKGKDVCERSTNADLYKMLFHHIEQRQRIPSHPDNPQAKTSKGLPKIRPDWVQYYDLREFVETPVILTTGARGRGVRAAGLDTTSVASAASVASVASASSSKNADLVTIRVT